MKRTSSDVMKIKNMVTIVSLIVSHPGINRKRVSELAGLSNQTVTNLVKELLDMGALMEFQLSERPQQGRPAIGLYFDYDGFHLISIEMTYNTARFFLHDLNGKVFSETSSSLSFGCDLRRILLDGIRTVLGDMDPYSVSSIVLNAEGVLDENSCTLTYIKSLGVKDFDVRKALSEIPIPVWAVNDVNFIAFDAMERSQDIQNFIVVKYASGTGASTALNRNIARTGRHNMPGKFSHMKLIRPGEHRKCWCGGENCLGTFFNKDALEEIYGMPYLEVIGHVADGKIPELRNDMVEVIGGVLVNIVTLLGLERIYFCGESFDILGDGFISEIDYYIRDKVPLWIGYTGIEHIAIKPSPILSSRFYLHIVLENVFEYLEENDRCRS